MLQKFQPLLYFARHVLRHIRQDKCLQLASSLTFTTLLSLVPLITIALTLISAFPVFATWTSHLQGFAMQNLLPEVSGKMITRYLDQFSDRAGQLTAYGTLFLGITAFMLMFTIERAFNMIWRVTQPRPMAQRVAIYWAMLTLGPVLIGASLSITSYLVTLSLGLALQIPFGAITLLRLVPMLLTIFAFTMLYYIVPNRQVRQRDALAGGIAAGLLFELMKRSFAVYITQVPTYTLVYGAFASIPIFLLWVYMSWLVIVLGAVIAALAPDYGHVRGGGRRPAGSVFSEALAVLRVLIEAQTRAEQMPLLHIAHAVRLGSHECEKVLERLAAAGWAIKSAGERWALSCDPDEVKLAEVYRLFVLSREAHEETRDEKQIAAVLEKFDSGAAAALDLPLRVLAADKQTLAADERGKRG